MRLALKVIDVGDEVLHPLCQFINTGMVVHGDWTVGWPKGEGDIRVRKGGVVQFEPELIARNGWVSTSVSSGKVTPDGKSLILDIDMSPIDLKLV